MRDYMPPHRHWLGILLGTLSLVGLYAISQYNFLLFHCLTEAFSIVIGIAVCAIYWNTRQFLDYGAYWVIGLGCVFAGIFDLIYIFAYPGMSVFPSADGNLALQAKTVAQWYVSLSCVGAAPFLRRKINQNLALAVYSVLLALALGALFYWRVFPDCFIAGVGITPFARLGLAISCSGYLGTLCFVASRRRAFDSYVFQFLVAALIAFLLEDAASAVATDLNGFARTVAHLCQIVAIYFIYKAFVVIGLTKPYDLLFRNQQQSAKALERQRQFLEAVLDNVQSGIVACDNKGVLSLFNRALREIHGLPAERLPAEQWAEHYGLYHPDGQTRMRTEELPLFRALKGEHLHDVEMVVIPKAGPARTCVASGVPLIGKDGVNHGAVVAMHDITERKRAEQAMKQAQEILEKAHAEQLQRHQAELAHVARLSMMGEMAASLAHELNQPLHAVNNYARGSVRRLLKMPAPDEELVDALTQISAEANRAAEIVRRVRGFVQKRETQFAAVLLNNLVEEVVLLSNAELEQRHARIALELADDLAPVRGDPIQIEQVLLNLVRNGLEAMDDTPEECRLLTVRTARQGDDAVQVEVCDSGVGIGSGDLERVFEPFITTKPEGMGMGLAISRSIIQAHGGRLWASANQDRGCTFRFTLPTDKRD